ncbi:MAG TPA: PKD domain-containing protein [Verrucomicrobiae bacterium]|nr:PKD domain-containing protein [Verrucomicrobiae bacterium]
MVCTVLSCLSGIAICADGQTFGYFTNKYGSYGTNFISIAPWTAQGIFFEGDTVTISNRIGTSVEVYDFHFNPLTNALPPVVLSHLGLGHYFIQVNGVKNGGGDRSQFLVLPHGYTNHPHADIGELPTATVAASNRFARLAPGWSRLQISWSTMTTNAAGTNDFTNIDRFVHGGPPYYYGLWGNGRPTEIPNPPVPLKVLNVPADHHNELTNPVPIVFGLGSPTNSYASPVADETNSLNSFIRDYSLLWSNIALRFTNSIAYEVLNEPNGSNFIFPEDVYSNVDSSGYPVSLVVSSATEAIKFVCPNCEVWSPSANGLANWGLMLFTNSFEIPAYNYVDAISFHSSSMDAGPVDSTLIYTNAQLGSGSPPVWLPTDSNCFIVARLYGKPLVSPEQYSMMPDVLGRTNSWWLHGGNSPGDVPQWSWNWYRLTTRWWKSLILFKASGVTRIQPWVELGDGGGEPRHPPTVPFSGTEYCGWDSGGEDEDIYGCGPRPNVDGEALVSWWLSGSTLLANWLSGSPLVIADPRGHIASGTPGLHFWEFQFADGTTNTFIWADEATTVATNFGVGLTDLYSNAWTGPIGMEPVLAWGWPNNGLGGMFSIQPSAAFTATPNYGPAPMTVTFRDVSGGAISSRLWQFGDGAVTNIPEITVLHRYLAPATNIVQLIVSGPAGVSTTTQALVTTPFPPPLNGGGINGQPPVLGTNTVGNATATNSPSSTGNGPGGTWRLLRTY